MPLCTLASRNSRPTSIRRLLGISARIPVISAPAPVPPVLHAWPQRPRRRYHVPEISYRLSRPHHTVMDLQFRTEILAFILTHMEDYTFFFVCWQFQSLCFKNEFMTEFFKRELVPHLVMAKISSIMPKTPIWIFVSPLYLYVRLFCGKIIWFYWCIAEVHFKLPQTEPYNSTFETFILLVSVLFTFIAILEFRFSK